MAINQQMHRVHRRVIRGADDAPALIRELEAAGYAGPRHEQFVEDLWCYGWNVLRGLVRTGRIATVRTAVPRGQLSPEDRRALHDSSALREELVMDALIWAVPQFIDHLKRGRWSATKGASLASYFTGTCAQGFWRAYRCWRTQRLRYLRLMGEHAELLADPDCDFANFPEQRDALDKILSEASSEQLAICAGILRGKTHAEIGEEIGLSSRAIEGRLYQLRRTAWGHVRAGRVDRALVPGRRARADDPQGNE